MHTTKTFFLEGGKKREKYLVTERASEWARIFFFFLSFLSAKKVSSFSDFRPLFVVVCWRRRKRKRKKSWSNERKPFFFLLLKLMCIMFVIILSACRPTFSSSSSAFFLLSYSYKIFNKAEDISKAIRREKKERKKERKRERKRERERERERREREKKARRSRNICPKAILHCICFFANTVVPIGNYVCVI